jgi:hypothetical protein
MHSPFARAARVAALAFAIAGCAPAAPCPSPQTPISQTQTTSATVPTRGDVTSPSYGSSDIDAWGDPAASGFANHGSANPGTTSRPLPPRQ